MRDLKFIAGNYLYGDVPLEKEYLILYYTSDLERKFLSYCLMFFDVYLAEGFLRFYNNFTDHTGHSCSRRWVRKLLKRYKELELSLFNAYKIADLTEITKIKSGQYYSISKSSSNTSNP